jgi:hypothetical protein
MIFYHSLRFLTFFIVFLSRVHYFNFSNNPWTILKLMTNNLTTKTNRAHPRTFLSDTYRPSAIITQFQSSFSFKCSPTFYVLHTSPRIIVLGLQSAKNFLGSCIHLLVQKLFLCIGITYLSSFPLILLKSNLSFNCTLAFILGHNLLNILKFMLWKQKISLIVLLPKNKDCFFRKLPLFFRSAYSLGTKLHNSSRLLYTSAVDLCIEILFFFTSVPSNHNSKTRHQNHLLAQGKTQGSMLNRAPTKPQLLALLTTPVKQAKSHPR